MSANPEGMASALLMVGRVGKAMQYAVREDESLAVFSAGAFLVLTGTVAYALGSSWNIVDAFCFAVSTHYHANVADLDLVLDDCWLKIFTVLPARRYRDHGGDPAQARVGVRDRQDAGANGQGRRAGRPGAEGRTRDRSYPG